ncbi:MAG TPA: hypothetical protein VGC18_13955 [Lacisediminihabitans sp.]|uniref:hypothetical protein n=1 Tax=Lacisediminihabitans sp. TaxID=2787631 RepID=UPI002ED90ADE
MVAAPDASALAAALPGSWRLGATNIPPLLGAERRDAGVSYELTREEPLVLSTVVTWSTPSGVEKHLRGRDRWRGDGFVRHGAGLRFLSTRRWTVTGLDEDGTIAAVRLPRSGGMPAGMEILLKEGGDAETLRARVAARADDLGITSEEFAGLTWLYLQA